MSAILQRLAREWRNRGSLGLVRFLAARLVQRRSDQLYDMDLRAATAWPAAASTERRQGRLVVVDRHNLASAATRAVERAVLTEENHAYREALQGRDWLGALVDEQGQVQCYGFVLHQSFYKRVLGEDDDVPMISNCFTSPAQRGQGHYPHMLRAICDELARRGQARSIITCSSDNAASIRGIEKAGFRCVKQVTVWVLAARLIVWRRERRCDHRADGREGR